MYIYNKKNKIVLYHIYIYMIKVIIHCITKYSIYVYNIDTITIKSMKNLL